MRLVTYFIIVFVSSAALVWAFSRAANKGLRKSQVDFYGKINAASDTAKNTELLVIGSSRVLVNIDTRILDSVTGLRSYNYGLNAAKIKTCLNLFNYALHFQQQANVLLLNIDFNMFEIGDDPYTDAYYYPFEKYYPGFLLNDSSTSSTIHKFGFLDVALYDDYVKYAAIDGWLRPNRKVTGGFNGYYPHVNLTDRINLNHQFTGGDQYQINEYGFSLLSDMANRAKAKGMKQVFVMAPYYNDYTTRNYSKTYQGLITRIAQFAAEKDILFLDFSALKLADDETNFYNYNHLNQKGAGLYTHIIADAIKNYLHPAK
ncbi:MAG: hypothetical protein WBO30_00770 [Ferruginibacter sp.]